MADMAEDNVAVALERVAGTVGRVEVKLDTALAAVLRRIDTGERDRQALHGRVTDLAATVERNGAVLTSHAEDIRKVDASTKELSERLGGAAAKWVPILIAGAAFLFTIYTFVSRL